MFGVVTTIALVLFCVSSFAEAPKPPEHVDQALGYHFRAANAEIDAAALRHANAVRERDEVWQQISSEYHIDLQAGDQIGPPPLFLITRHVQAPKVEEKKK